MKSATILPFLAERARQPAAERLGPAPKSAPASWRGRRDQEPERSSWWLVAAAVVLVLACQAALAIQGNL